MSPCCRLAPFLVLLPAAALAQRPIALGKPNAEFEEPFTQLTAIRELRDGRVLVADARDKVLQLVDMKGGATKVGREGAGPGEYGIPSRLVALPNDTSALYDAGNTRYLLIHPDGTVGRTFKLEGSGGSGPQGLGLTVRAVPRGVDARGNIYYEGSGFQLSATGDLVPSDSSAVVRFDRAALRADTVAFTRLPKNNASVTPTRGGGVQVVRGLANPLTPRDDWVVLPDGRVAVLRADDYHVDVFASRASRRSGAPIAFERIAVNEAVRKMVEDDRLRAIRNAVVINSGRGGQPARGAPPPLSALRPLTDWPDVMPPFLASAAIVRPNGQIWVLRSRRPGDAQPRYDVLDDAGRVIGHVLLPEHTRLVGFGTGTVYLARTDDDDFEHLQRYPLAFDARLTR